MADPTFADLLSRSLASASWLELAVLLLLLVFSILSWAVIIAKVRSLARLASNHQRFHEAFATAAHSGDVAERLHGTASPSLLQAVFAAGLQARTASAPNHDLAASVDGHLRLRTAQAPDERIRLAMEHALKAEMQRLNRHLQFLASAGSASPFIGLFGTVWGIMGTFQTLGSAKSASLQVLAPPIAAALIATAAGLAVAIPAVMAYNWITSRLDEEHEGATCLIERLLHLMRADGTLPNTGATADSLTAPTATN
jgi:biopolymer transport protein TolQ